MLQSAAALAGAGEEVVDDVEEEPDDSPEPTDDPLLDPLPDEPLPDEPLPDEPLPDEPESAPFVEAPAFAPLPLDRLSVL